MMNSTFQRLARIACLAGAVVVIAALSPGCSKSSDVGSILKAADRHYDKREFEAAKIGYLRAFQLQQTNAHAILRLGLIFYDQGQVQQAFPFLYNSRTTFPADLQVREALALIYSFSGTNLWEAEIDAILKISPTNEVAVMTLVRTASTPESEKAVADRVRTLRSQHGDSAVYHVADAEFLRRRGDKAGAEAALLKAISIDPGSILAHIGLGNSYAIEGRKDEARKHLLRAAELAPPHGPARLRLAQFYVQTDQVDEATKVLDAIIDAAPEVISAWVARAEIALGKKELPEARRFLSRALAQSPTDAAALRLQAQVELAENKPADAVKTLEMVVKSVPRSSEVHYQLGVANLLNKDINRAIASLKESIRLEPSAVGSILLLAELDIARGAAADAISYLTDVARNAPQVIQARMLLGRAYRAKGRLDDAIAVYSSIQQQFPSNAPPVFQLGLVLRQKGRRAEAREAFERCLTLVPNDFAAVEQLVGLDLDAKDLKSAARRTQEALDKDPKAAAPWVLHGRIRSLEKKTDEAEAAFKKAVSLDGDSQPALMALAELYISSGKTKEALAELQRAVEKDPKNVGALSLTGILSVEIGQLQEGRNAYEQALRANPNAVLPLNNLAYLLSEKLKDPAAALPHALRARELAPKSPVIADTLGWIEFRRGNYVEALRLLADAADQLPSSAEIQYHLGMAYYMMGQESPALIALQTAAKSETEFPGRDVARDSLKFLEGSALSPTPADIPGLEERRKKNPADIITLNRLGAAFVAARQFDKARDAFDAALRVNTNSASSLIQLASLHAIHLGNNTRAMELARQARAASPADDTIALAVGRIAYALGDATQAHNLFLETSRRSTNNLEVLLDLAVASYSLGRVDESVGLARRVQSTTNAVVAEKARRFLLAHAATTSTPPPDANAVVASILQSEPTHIVALFAKAISQERSKDATAAAATLEAILQRFPQFLPATRHLALLLANELADDAKAYPLATKARESFPKDAELAATLGKLASRRADHRYAIQLLEEASASRPSDADVLYHLGKSRIALKQNETGKAALEKAIQLAPQSKFVPDAKSAIADLARSGG